MSLPIFHALTTAEWLRVARELTFSEVKVIYYLQSLCPYGNDHLEVRPSSDAKKLEMGRSTLCAALSSLAEKQYITISRTRPSYKVRPNLISPIALKAMQQTAGNSNASDKLAAQQPDRQPNDIPSDPPDEAIYEDRARDKTKKTKDLLDSEAGKQRSSRELVLIQKRTAADESWPPPGPWQLEDGKLDPNFLAAVAQRWVKDFGGELHDRELHVLQYFQKDPRRLPPNWRWYAAEYRQRYEKALEIHASGGTLAPDYQARLVAHRRAIAASLPDELNPVSPGVAAVNTAPALSEAPEPTKPGSDRWSSARLKLFNQMLKSGNPSARTKAIEAAREHPNYQLQHDPETGLPTRIVEVQS